MHRVGGQGQKRKRERERENRIHVKAGHPPPLPATRKEERGTERRSRLG